MHATLLRTVCIAAIALLVSACGWHPRGSDEARPTLHQLRLAADHPDEALAIRVRRLLGTAGVDVRSEAGHGPSLHLGAERKSTRKVSLDRSARAAEQEMRVTTSFDVRNADGDIVFGPRTVSASRIYAYDPNSIIALEGEEELIHQELRDEVANQILRQLRYVPATAGRPGKD